MARSFAPSLLVLATLIALVLPQLGLCVATLTQSEGQENFDTSLSNPTLTHKYDVFVSFRGEDTRTSFTAYLFDAFDRIRIRAYRDDVDLPRGAEIESELLKAIETSRIAVVVFSKNYATSHWCLDELVKIMECKRLLNQNVMPIFYDVSQSMVLEQKGIFAEALLNGSIDKVNNWRTALKEAANLAGFQLEPHGPEPEFIEEIVETIWEILHVESPTSTTQPCRRNDVPGQYSSLIIPQLSAMPGLPSGHIPIRQFIPQLGAMPGLPSGHSGHIHIRQFIPHRQSIPQLSAMPGLPSGHSGHIHIRQFIPQLGANTRIPFWQLHRAMPNLPRPSRIPSYFPQ